MERPGRASVGAIVLAGGRGSRLGGVDKATLIVDGSTLLDTVLAATGGCAPRVVVGPPELRVPAGVIVTREEPVFSGPASAVAAGSMAVATADDRSPEWILLLACDVPDVGAAVPRLIDAARSAGPGVEVLFADDGRADGRTEWLVAIVRTDALTRAIDALGAGGTVDASMRRLLSGLPAASVPVPRGATDDIDTPADLTGRSVHDPPGGGVVREPMSGPVEPSESAVPSSVPPRNPAPKRTPPMSERSTHDLDSDRWDAWITEVCARLDVDRAVVDVSAIHDLTRRVAHRFERPMAPVSSYVVGVAVGLAARAGDGSVDPGLLDRLIDEVDATLPPES